MLYFLFHHEHFMKAVGWPQRWFAILTIITSKMEMIRIRVMGTPSSAREPVAPHAGHSAIVASTAEPLSFQLKYLRCVEALILIRARIEPRQSTGANTFHFCCVMRAVARPFV